MMLLGIVLHASETYSIGGDLWPKDPNSTNAFFNYLSSIIHIFRMPIFFLISGFFSAMLFYERSPKTMMTQRLKRVVAPFLVFLVILHPIIASSFNYMIQSYGLTDFEPMKLGYLPTITYHLWFLYYLIIITCLVTLTAFILKKAPSISRFVNNTFKNLFERQFLFVAVGSIYLFLLLVWMWDFWAPTPLGFSPDIKLIIFYGSFFIMGWLVFKSKELLKLFMKYDRAYVIIAFILYTVKFIFRNQIDDVPYGALNTIIGWFFIIGITGLFMRYFNEHSSFRRYLSDASYWVYLVHLPLTLIIPTLIVDWPIPSGLKFTIVVIGTTSFCFLTYHYLVRGTFIGQFLNGRRYN